MRTPSLSRALVALSAALALGVFGTGCSLNPSSLASSVRNAGDGYDLTLIFDTALNLPGGADVKANGASVGTVRDVELIDDGVEVVVRLKNDVRVPVEATGSIRQTTILGDPYVSLESVDSDSSGYLESGAVIGADRTTSAPPLEDTLAVLATFVNGGNIQKMEEVIRDVNKILPDLSDLQRITTVMAIDVRDVGDRNKEVDRMLDGLIATTEAIEPRREVIEQMFTPGAMHYWSKMSSILGNIGVVLPSIGSVFEGGFWLVPMLDEMNATVFAVRDEAEGVAPTVSALNSFLEESLFPFVEKPSFDIVSASSDKGSQMIGTMEKVLRMLGAVR